jgi:TetR/AcrR family transcriptional repressor of mexCD-oprJ operon
LFRRGIAEGSLRGDVPAELLLAMYGDLIEGSIERMARDHTGVEATSSALLGLFLDGAAVQR